MKKQEYINKAIEEILHPKFENTKEFLEVCKVELEHGKPKVARVSESYFEELVAVYFAVQEERYFIEVHLTKAPEIEIDSVWTEAGHRVYLTAISEELSYDKLAKFINKFSHISGWSKGDLRKNGQSKYTFSRVRFEPIENRAYGLEEKFVLLLDELEKDIEGVQALNDNSHAVISVCRDQCLSSNTAISFDIGTINRLNKLNLGIDLDIYDRSL